MHYDHVMRINMESVEIRIKYGIQITAKTNGNTPFAPMENAFRLGYR